MTREEAISILRNTAWLGSYEMTGKVEEAINIVAEALKAQEACGDAVSRQTLQKELALYPIDDVTSEDEAGYNRAINDIQKMVLHLPSAQPELAQNLHNACTDLISRKEVIKLLDEAWVDGHEYQGWLHDEVNRLPSAQPDIIRCRNCKFASGDSRICMKFGHSPIGELDFCAWAERRTDEQ